MSASRVVPSARSLALALAMLASFAVTYARTALHPELFLFAYDSAEHVHHVLDIIEGSDYPLVGNAVSAQELRLGPFGYYAFVPAFVFGHGPRAMGVWLGTLSGLASAGLVWLGWRRVNPVAGVLAGLFHASSATTLEWSVNLLCTSLMPAASVAALIAVTRAVEQRTSFPVGTGVVVGLACHCHAIEVSFLPALPIGLVLAGARLRLKQLVGYGAGFALTYVPWVVYEAQVNRWEQVKSLGALFGGRVHFWVPAGTVGNSMISLVEKVARPRVLLQGGLLAGVLVASWITFAIWSRRDGRVARPWIALMATCAATFTGWLAFVGTVGVRSPAFQDRDFTRFVLPVLPVLCLMAAIGWAAPFVALQRFPWRERPAARAARLVRAVGAGVASLSIAYAFGVLGEVVTPYWQAPREVLPPPAEIQPRLAFVEALADSVTQRLGGRIPNEAVFVGSHDLRRDEENTTAVISMMAVLRLRRVEAASAGEPPPRPFPRITALYGPGCESLPGEVQPLRLVDRIGVRAFDDCSEFRGWVESMERDCRVRGERVRMPVSDLRGNRELSECLPFEQRAWSPGRDRSLGELVTALEAGTRRARIDAAWALGDRGVEAATAIPVLEVVTGDADPDVAIESLWALTRVDASGTIARRAGIAATRSPHEALRMAAVLSLYSLAGRSAEVDEAIRGRLQDESPSVRAAAKAVEAAEAGGPSGSGRDSPRSFAGTDGPS